MKDRVVELKIPKNLTEKIPSEFEYDGVFNIIHIPENVRVGNINLSHGIMHPSKMMVDVDNEDMMICKFNCRMLEDNAIKVYLRNGNTLEPIDVDIDVLCEKIENALENNYKHEEEIEF